MLPHLISRAGLSAFAAGALLVLSPRLSHAEQFVLFDETFTMTWEDAIGSSPSKSHHYVKPNSGLNPERPGNWVSPVNYRKGKVYIHLEVLEKAPGGQSQGWALCYVGGGSYGCPYTKYYTEPGVYDSVVEMQGFYNHATIDFTQGISEVDLVYTINNSGSGHVHFFPELKDKTTPTKVRIAMVQVSEGGVYDPSILPGVSGGGAGGADGGGAGGMAAGGAGVAGPAAGGPPGGGGGVTGGGGAGAEPPIQGGVGGNTAGASNVAGGGAPAGAGTPASSGASSATPFPSAAVDDGGCSVGGIPASSPAPWLALAAVWLWRSRRQKH